MKISNFGYLRDFKLNCNFKKTVDYGAKDKDLVYIPILFDEEDTFVPSSQQDGTKNTNTSYKPKVGKIVSAGGGVFAAIEVIPDTINKVINKTSDVAKNSMQQIKSVKDTYNETFNKPSPQESETAHLHAQANNSNYEQATSNNHHDNDNYDILSDEKHDSTVTNERNEHDEHNSHITEENNQEYEPHTDNTEDPTSPSEPDISQEPEDLDDLDTGDYSVTSD